MLTSITNALRILWVLHNKSHPCFNTWMVLIWSSSVATAAEWTVKATVANAQTYYWLIFAFWFTSVWEKGGIKYPLPVAKQICIVASCIVFNFDWQHRSLIQSQITLCVWPLEQIIKGNWFPCVSHPALPTFITSRQMLFTCSFCMCDRVLTVRLICFQRREWKLPLR